MNLLEIRKWFVAESGRYDLITDPVSWADNGANNYIHSGQKMLDRLLDVREWTHTHEVSTVANTSFVPVPRCRAIKSVSVTTASYECVLTKSRLKLAAFKRLSLTPGTPSEYFPVQSTDGVAGVFIGIHLTPIPDAVYTLEVEGFFDTPKLTTDVSENFWSLEHPNILVMAAQCQLEMFSRNTEGVKDWMSAIEMLVTTISFDAREQELTGITHMGG